MGLRNRSIGYFECRHEFGKEKKRKGVRMIYFDIPTALGNLASCDHCLASAQPPLAC